MSKGLQDHKAQRFLYFACLLISLCFFAVRNANAFPADFDGDGKSDLAVWRPATGYWYVIPSTGNCPAHLPYTGWGYPSCMAQWGLPGDTPISGDFDGDHKADLVVIRAGTWYIKYSNGAPWVAIPFNYGGKPDETDRNADGLSDMINITSSYVYTRVFVAADRMIYIEQLPRPLNSNYSYQTALDAISANYGTPTYAPASAGDAAYLERYIDNSVYSNKYRIAWKWNSWTGPYTGGSWVGGRVQSFNTGVIWNVKAMAGNYIGNDATRYADYVYYKEQVTGDPSSLWYMYDSQGNVQQGNPLGWGLVGDTPLAGDFDGDGKSDPAVWRPATLNWYVLMTSDPTWCPSYMTSTGSGGCMRQWGLSGDVPIS